MRSCVAINQDGSAEFRYNTIKDAAADSGLGIRMMRKALLNKLVVGNYRWVFEEEYHKALLEDDPSRFQWRKRTRKVVPVVLNDEEKIYRSRIIRRKFMAVAQQYHFPWVERHIQLWMRCRKHDAWPWSIARYYKDKRDKEIALFAMIPFMDHPANQTRIEKMRRRLGDHPWEWFSKRLFISAPKSDENLLKMAEILDILWAECFDSQNRYNSIMAMIRKSPIFSKGNYHQTLCTLFADTGIKNLEARIALLLLALSSAKGIGQKVWLIKDDYLTLPMNSGTIKCLKTWFPEWEMYGNADDAARLFGFGIDGFYIFSLAWASWREDNIKKCSAYERWYAKLYKSQATVSQFIWFQHQPTISF